MRCALPLVIRGGVELPLNGVSSVPNPHPELVAHNATAFSAPSVAQVAHSSVIAADGPSASLRFYWQAIGTVPWHPELVAGAGTTFA